MKFFILSVAGYVVGCVVTSRVPVIFVVDERFTELAVEKKRLDRRSSVDAVIDETLADANRFHSAFQLTWYKVAPAILPEDDVTRGLSTKKTCPSDLQYGTKYNLEKFGSWVNHTNEDSGLPKDDATKDLRRFATWVYLSGCRNKGAGGRAHGGTVCGNGGHPSAAVVLWTAQYKNLAWCLAHELGHVVGAHDRKWKVNDNMEYMPCRVMGKGWDCSAGQSLSFTQESVDEICAFNKKTIAMNLKNGWGFCATPPVRRHIGTDSTPNQGMPNQGISSNQGTGNQGTLAPIPPQGATVTLAPIIPSQGTTLATLPVVGTPIVLALPPHEGQIESSRSRSSFPLWAVVLIGFVVISFLATLVYVVWKKKKEKKKDQKTPKFPATVGKLPPHLDGRGNKRYRKGKK